MEHNEDDTLWLETAIPADSTAPVRVVFDGREGRTVFVRQADPGDGEAPPPVPIQRGDNIVVMTAVSHISHHLTEEPGDATGYLFSTRVVPVRRDGQRVYARTLRHDEADTGDRIHLRPGDDLQFEAGSIVAELAAIDLAERQGAIGYTPLTPVLWTWFRLGAGHSESKIRFLLAAARRLDTANSLFDEVHALQGDDLPAPQQRRNMFALVGAVEMAIIALGRSLDMVVRAETLLNISAPPPPVIQTAMQSITDIRNAYEHIEDRALGQVRQVPHPDALSIFDFTALVERKQITYGTHSLDLLRDVPELMVAARDYLKYVAGESGG